jgi:transcriptional regulator with XRE-family HTH domain
MTRKNGVKNTKIGLKIKLERTKLNISQEDLAFRANVNKNTIGAIERGAQSPTFDTLEAITGAFDITVQDLCNFDNL